MSFPEYQDDGFFTSGHVACAGCSEALAMRVILNTIGSDAIAVVPPSCGAVICGMHPHSAMGIPVCQTTLESTAATASGVKRALNARGKKDTTVICLAGDGGTYDIGFQALSSAVERNEDLLYICFDNEGYMNTGGQKSSSTPLMAVTGSTPEGKSSRKKNMIEILAAHDTPYVATTSPSNIKDMVAKVNKAKNIRGFKFISVLIPCIAGWGLADDAGIRLARLAVEAGVWPLYEIENGQHYRLNHTSKTATVEQYLVGQKRYRHVSEQEVARMQANIDADWQRLQQKVAASGESIGVQNL